MKPQILAHTRSNAFALGIVAFPYCACIRHIAITMLLLFCLAQVAPANDDNEENENVKAFKQAMLKGGAKTLSPELAKMIERYDAAEKAKSQVERDIALDGLRAAGAPQNLLEILRLASQLNGAFENVRDESGEMTGELAARGILGAIKYFSESSSPRNPKSELPEHVIRTEGGFQPEPGYGWTSQEQKDLSVRWSAGSKHRNRPHIVAAANEGKWLPETGYEWAVSPASSSFDLQTKMRGGDTSPNFRSFHIPGLCTMQAKADWTAKMADDGLTLSMQEAKIRVLVNDGASKETPTQYLKRIQVEKQKQDDLNFKWINGFDGEICGRKAKVMIYEEDSQTGKSRLRITKFCFTLNSGSGQNGTVTIIRPVGSIEFWTPLTNEILDTLKWE